MLFLLYDGNHLFVDQFVLKVDGETLRRTYAYYKLTLQLDACIIFKKAVFLRKLSPFRFKDGRKLVDKVFRPFIFNFNANEQIEIVENDDFLAIAGDHMILLISYCQQLLHQSIDINLFYLFIATLRQPYAFLYDIRLAPNFSLEEVEVIATEEDVGKGSNQADPQDILNE